MSRIVSVWLPQWPIERLAIDRPGSVPRDRPFALVEGGARGLVVTAVNGPAAAAGVVPGLALADARARAPALGSTLADPVRDRAALVDLARWLGRYGPNRNIDDTLGVAGGDARLRAHALWIDSAGVAHLFGGEARLLADLTHRLAAFGITALAGLADTPGAASALARFATQEARCRWAIAAVGDSRAALASLPVAALRIVPETSLLLGRLGLKRIGDLDGLPRSALAHRFRDAGARPARGGQGAGQVAGRGQSAGRGKSAKAAEGLAGALLRRLDQALGACAEPRPSLDIAPDALVRQAFEPPLISADGIAAALAALTRALCAELTAAGRGARRLRLGLYRTDGTLAEVRAGTRQPCRDSSHMNRLLGEKIATLDAGFGIDLMTLAAAETAPFDAQGTATLEGPDEVSHTAADALIDRLSNRLGAARVGRLAAAASHLPEAADVARPALFSPAPRTRAEKTGDPATPAEDRPRRPARPTFLLAYPEPVQVLAEIPDGAPVRLVWRRHARRIVKAEGPERIAPEWWRALEVARDDRAARRPAATAASAAARTRDYYRLEDDGGQGYWVFRAGLYGREDDADADTADREAEGVAAPRWFLHGVFA